MTIYLLAGFGIGGGLVALLIILLIAWSVRTKPSQARHMAETERLMAERNGLDVQKIAVLRDIASTLLKMEQEPQ